MVADGGDAAVLLEMQVRFGDDVELFTERFSTAGREVNAAGGVHARPEAGPYIAGRS